MSISAWYLRNGQSKRKISVPSRPRLKTFEHDYTIYAILIFFLYGKKSQTALANAGSSLLSTISLSTDSKETSQVRLQWK